MSPDTNVSGLLDGKRVIVTGGGRGIGRAVCELMFAAGAQVTVADLDSEGAAQACEEIGPGSPRLRSCAVDIGQPDQITAMVSEATDAFGGLDVLVNCAAHARFGTVLELTPEDWDYSYEIALRGNFLCMQAAARVMAESGNGGKIVNISSMTVTLGHVYNCAYSAMKGGIEAMTRVAAVELAQHDIQVNTVSPGPVDTPMARSLSSDWGWQQRLNHLPGGRLGLAPDIAGAIVFLSSGLSDWVTGTTIPVDGGYTTTGAIPQPLED